MTLYATSLSDGGGGSMSGERGGSGMQQSYSLHINVLFAREVNLRFIKR